MAAMSVPTNPESILQFLAILAIRKANGEITQEEINRQLAAIEEYKTGGALVELTSIGLRQMSNGQWALRVQAPGHDVGGLHNTLESAMCSGARIHTNIMEGRDPLAV